MSRSPAAYGLAARLARREVMRRPWRTLLVALLVALPVAAMTMAVVLFRTDSLTTQEEWSLEFGNADALLDPSDATSPPPAGAHTTTVTEAGQRGLRTTDGERTRARITDVSLDDPTTAPIVRIDDGRAPRAPGEVLVSPNVADAFGAQLGDTVHLERPVPQDVTIVGIGRMRAYLDERLVVVPHGSSLLGAVADSSVTYVDLLDDATLSDAARSLPEDARLSPDLGAELVTEHTSTDDAVRWTWILGGVVLTVVGIVIASAFAASARRQLTTLGQLAANGAGPHVLRRALFFQGTWTGIVGTALGFTFGAIGLVIASPHVERLFQRDVGSYVVRPADLVPIAVIGVLAATIAALIPARTTSRVPVLAALAGRRPLTRVPRWVTASGFVAIGSGLALLGLAVIGATRTSGQPGSNNDQSIWAATAVLGGMAVLLGACAIAPAYVSLLDHLAIRMSGTWRFAARSLARQRTRTGAVVSGLCAAGALAIATSALVLGAVGADEANAASARYDEVHVSSVSFTDDRQELPVAPDEALVGGLLAAIPGARRIDLTAVAVHDGRVAVVADAAAIDAYELDDAAQKSLEDVGAIQLVSADASEPLVRQLRFTANGPAVDLARVSVSTRDLGDLPHELISPALVTELGLTTTPGPVILRADHDLTADELSAVEDARDDYYSLHPDRSPRPVKVASAGGKPTPVQVPVGASLTFVQAFSASNDVDPFLVEAILSGIALGFALVVVAVSLALAASETRDERDVLAIVGAAPVTMRRTSAHKAAIMTVMGGLLAIPVGFLPVVVFTRADRAGGPLLIFPWRTVVLLVIAVPVITALATTAASALALRVRPVHVSTMTFE